jgi:hypothetical protein
MVSFSRYFTVCITYQSLLVVPKEINKQEIPGRATGFSLFQREQAGQPNILSLLIVLSWALQRRGREAVRTFSSGVDFKNAWSYTSIPPYTLTLCLQEH